MVKVAWLFLLNSNRKSYALYRMVVLLMTLGDPLTTLNHLSFKFCVALCMFVIGDCKDFTIDEQVECANHNLRTTNHP